MKTVLPEIPPETLVEWQRVVDLTARLARVPASLIMRTERPTHTVLVSSRTEGNPYAVGREYDLNAVLYCQGVFDNDGELVVEDATRDPVWAANEDLADGMRFYIGYPLKWPSGEVFGTICVLDRERNEQLLQQINTLVMPHVAKLARLVERDRAAVEYVSLIETNLKTLTSSLSSRMARVFQALTATEADVAHLVMRGLTTKDIAATLSRAPSTIDSHRNNIRVKLGVARRVTLRAYLLSIR